MTNEMDELIRKVLDGKASEEEMRVLMRWMKEDGSHREYFNMLKKVWNMTNGPKLSPERKALEMERFVGYMQNSSLKKREHLKSKVVRLWYRYVAVLLIPLLLLGIYFWSEQKSEPILVNTETNVDFGKPVLMMADGREVILEQKNEIIEGASEIGIQNDSLFGLNYMGAGLQANVSTGEEVYNTLSIPVGGFYQLSLSDGTKVWLAATSKLRYPVHFVGDCREVYLEGEAFFDVARDTTKPFIVKCDDFSVKALGTSFDVSCYDDDEYALATLASGKIEVTLGEEKRILTPGEQAMIREKTLVVKEVNILPYTSWMEDRLYFFNGMEVCYAHPGIQELHFTGNVPKYTDIKKVFDMLEFATHLDFSLEKGKVVISQKKE